MDEVYKDFLNDEEFENFISQYNKCYVYELFVKETGEIFHVGYYSAENNDEPLDSGASDPERMIKLMSPYHETGIRVIKTGLTEAKADYFTRKRIKEVESNNMLRIGENITIPGYETCEVGVAPKIYVSAFERHYFGKETREFDRVDISSLKTVYLDTGYMYHNELMAALFDNRYEEYYNTLVSKLEAIGAKIVKNKFAKSITAWVYMAKIGLHEYEKEQNRAINKIGRNVPTYHIFDVLEKLKDVSIVEQDEEVPEIHPAHSRCSLSMITKLEWGMPGYREAQELYWKGETCRTNGNITEAISFYDQARENGFLEYYLYDSYAKAYRKIKDYDNEIAILQEHIEVVKMFHSNSHAMDLKAAENKERIAKVVKLLVKSRQCKSE